MTIEGWLGLPGMGKTYLMTRRAMKDMLKGYDVYANYKLEGAHFFTELHEVFNVKNAKILIDEASLVVPSQAWNSIPFEVLSNWRQHRHKGVDIYYTAQDKSEVIKALRTLTQYVHHCFSMGLDKPWWFTWKTRSFSGRDKFGGGFSFFDPWVAEAYNTHDVDVAAQSFIKTGYGSGPLVSLAPVCKGEHIDIRA